VDPGSVQHAARQTIVGHVQAGLFVFDSQLRYTCDAGRRFEDGYTSRVVLCDVRARLVCDVRAAWNDSQFTCDCT